ncbi:MAG TPA: pilus assembly protein TadG-related protein [Candidatus Angelobacter sp.]|nr:pilus assembly protein TadG-related protein [Candidatus Angelobacter sp.]
MRGGGRSGRGGERGHAAALVALGCVSLLAVMGLAIDGGMEAGAYRHAQNAADAGALAAARTMYLNATATPQKPTDGTTLNPVAQAEVTHNHASALGSTTTAAQTAYVPNAGGGLQGIAAFADVYATAGTILAPLDAHMELVGAHSTASSRTPATGGSVATSLVQIAGIDAPSAGLSGTVTCWQASAQYSAGVDVTGTATPCATGTIAAGVTASGALSVSPGADARVYANNHPAAAPTLQVSAPAGQDGPVTVSSASAAAHNLLGWNAAAGLTSFSSTYASDVQASLTGLNISVDVLDMYSSVSVDSHGVATATLHCTPATISVTNTVSHVKVTAHVDASCSAPGLSVSGVSVPYTQPSSNACSTNAGVVSCSYQTCFVRATVAATPFPMVLCIGENNVVLAASPETEVTGTATVSAKVDQPTYFLGVLGWTHTTPSTTAVADLEAVVDESPAAFIASPFAMPDTATNMAAPYAYEHLRAGQTYYLYGPSMQTDNPSPWMPAAWQGQLSSTSSHRAGTTLTGSATTNATPQPYLNHGPYYLEPIFDPVSGLVESYGVFLPVTGHPNWGTLVNSISSFPGQPTLHGYIVQATSQPGWIPYLEGAVAVKLLQ